MSGLPSWLWSDSLGGYYYIDPRTGEHVLQNGRRLRLPPAPKPRFVPPHSVETSSQPELGGSPPGPDANYRSTAFSAQTGAPVQSVPPSYGKGKGRDYNDSIALSTFQSLSLGSHDASSSAAASGSVPPRPQTLSHLIRNEAGDEIVETVQPHTKVVSRTQSTPAERITDPKLLRPGFQAHKKLLETPNDTELDPGQSLGFVK